MQNVTKNMLKKAIFLTQDEFEEVLGKIYPYHKVKANYDMDGMTVEVDEDTANYTEFLEKLTEYYGVEEVTSVHMDDCDYAGIWVIYKDSHETTSDEVRLKVLLYNAVCCMADKGMTIPEITEFLGSSVQELYSYDALYEDGGYR